MRRAPGKPAAWVLPLALAVAVYSVPVGGRPSEGSPNELSRILLMQAIVAHGTPAIDRPIEVYGASQDQAVRDGRAYSDKAPGMSFLAVPIAWALRPILPESPGAAYPAYWPLRHTLVWCLVAMPAVVGMFLLLRRNAPPAQRADRGWLALLLCLGTPLMSYSVTFFSHVTAGLLIAWAWVLALRTDARPPEGRAARTLAGGFLAGFAVTVEYPTALLAGVLLLAVLVQGGGMRGATWFLAGGALGLAPALAYHTIAFGSPLVTGYAYKSFAAHAAVHSQGLSGVTVPSLDRLWGILFGSQRGIFFYAPLLLLAPLGLLARRRVSVRQVWPVAVALTAYVLFAAGFVDWQGGWGAAARHLVPIVPLLALPVAWAVEAWAGRGWFAVLFVTLGGISVGQQLLSVAVTPMFPEIFDAPLVQLAVPSLLDGAGMPNLMTELTGITPIVVVALWSALGLLGCALAAARLLPRGRAWAFTGLLVAAASGLTLQWMARPVPTTSQERARAIVLDRLGYHELALRVDRATGP